MTYLLDSQVVLWLLTEPSKVRAEVMRVLKDPLNDRWISAATFWELEIKRAKGKLKFDVAFSEILRDFAADELPLTSKHIEALRKLPRLHNDPFDRILVAQAINEGLTLVTADGIIPQYQVPVLAV
jgi:PIN domain nuclease of toxin-antitoxin system